MNARIILVAVLAAQLHGVVSYGDVVEYHTEDREQWFTDIGGVSNVSTVNFVGFDDFTPVGDQWAHLGIHFSGQVFTSGESFFFYPNDGWGIEGYPDINVSFDQPINWVAADFPGEMFIELYSGGDLIYSSERFGFGGTGFFGGVMSTHPFDSARIFREAVNVTFLDDLHFGPPINVPAPGALMAIGLGLLARRRRSRLAS